MKTIKINKMFFGAILFLLTLNVAFSSSNSDCESFYESENADETFKIVEQGPQFKEDDDALDNYLLENLEYPLEAKKDSIEGIVLTRFVIEKDGSITNFEIMRNTSDFKEFEKEAKRLIENMPDWQPGRQAGCRVRVEKLLPIHFELD